MIAISNKVNFSDSEDIYGWEAGAPLELLYAGPAFRIDAGSRKEGAIEVSVAADTSNNLVKRDLFIAGTESPVL